MGEISRNMYMNESINGTIWCDLLDDARKYPNKTYEELKIPYNFDLDRISDNMVEKLKEVIYDVRNDLTLNPWNLGSSLGMIGITGSCPIEDSSEVLRIESSGDLQIGVGSPNANLYIEGNTNNTWIIMK